MKPRTAKAVVIAIVVIVAGVALWLLWRQGTIGISTTGQEKEISLEEFDALPYLAHVVDDPDPERKGVVRYDQTRSHPGVNLLTSRLVGGTHLLDMEGNILHSWLPGKNVGQGWVYSQMDSVGNLTTLVMGVGLVKMNWNAEVLWVSGPAENPYLNLDEKTSYHHDFEVMESGDILVIATEFRKAEFFAGEHRIRDDSIVILDFQGVPKGKIPLFDLLHDFVPESRFEYDPEKRKSMKMPGVHRALQEQRGFDVFHANTIERIPRDIGIAGEGDLLFCARNLDLIGILNPADLRLIWTWGPGVLERPHHPTLLNNGNILVFDNGMRIRKHSRVLELDPATEEIVWMYEATPPEAFFSKLRGSNQRLPNGNTLITESEKGRAFEVTENGDIVWDFWNFEMNERGQRGVIYRMVRYEPGVLKQIPEFR